MFGLSTSSDELATGSLDSHLIAATRLILAVSAVLILDYTSMARFNSDATRLVLVLYIAYSAALYLLTASRIRHKQAIPIWSQWTDIVWYTLLLALSGGSNSIFSLDSSLPSWLPRLNGLHLRPIDYCCFVLPFVTVGLVTSDQGSAFELHRSWFV